jgi:predicted RNA binding protein YcfA (HicA-like mRNA interferase family)
MPRLPVVSGEQTIKALERLGFRRGRQRGSHAVLRKDLPDGAVGCVAPLHRELALGTLRGILKPSKVTVEEFSNALR